MDERNPKSTGRIKRKVKSFFSFLLIHKYIYSVMLVSSVQQNDSVINVYTYLYSFSDSFPL